MGECDWFILQVVGAGILPWKRKFSLVNQENQHKISLGGQYTYNLRQTKNLLALIKNSKAVKKTCLIQSGLMNLHKIRILSLKIADKM